MLTPSRTKALSLLGGAALALALAAAPSVADDLLTVPASPTGTTSVSVDQPVTFDGTVDGPRRTVLLQQKDATGWRNVASTHSLDDGSYSLDVPTWWYAGHRVRAHAPQKKVRVSPTKLTTYPAVTSDPRQVNVNYGYTPVGDASDYATFYPDGRGRWNPCAAITWAYNAGGVTDPQALPVITASVQEISRATGIRFKYVGTTTKVPWRDKVTSPTNQPADMIIAWATPAQVPDLSGSVIGWGGATLGLYHFTPGTHGVQSVEFTNGGLVLDETTDGIDMTYTSTDNISWGQTVRHEIAHVMGLDHVMVETQSMYPMAQTDNEVFGAGDYAGLRAEGAASGCVPHAYRTAATSNGLHRRPTAPDRRLADLRAVLAPLPGPRA